MKKTNKQGASDYGAQRITPGMWVLIVLVAFLALFVPVLLSMDTSMVARYNLNKYHVGELCDETLYAPTSFEFVDEVATSKALEEAQKAILPTFTYSLNSTLETTSRVERFITAWQDGGDGARRFLAQSGLSDEMQVVERFEVLEASDRASLLSALRESMQKLLEGGLYADADLDTIRSDGYASFVLRGMPGQNTSRKIVRADEVSTRSSLEKNLTGWFDTYTVSFSGYQLILLEDTLRLLSVENVRYDVNQTLLEREKAKDSTPPVYVTVTKGQMILEKDKVITQSQIALLEEVAKHRAAYSWYELAGRLVYTVIVTACSIIVFLMFIPHSPRKYQYLRFALVAVMVGEIAGYFLVRYSRLSLYNLHEAVVPYMLAPLFVSQITDKKRYGAVVAFLVAAYAVLLPESNIMTFFVCVTNGAVCVFFFQHADRKVENIYHWLYACISCIFIEIAFSLMADVEIATLIPVIGALVANITVSVAFDSLVVSICENAFNLPTESRLNELAYSQSPLLDRLQMAAPGTYNHSVNVSELAFETAKAIGANAMLARVGGLYHDIGKMDYPEYYVENQGEENRQNALKPSLSVAIIKSHVKTGMEKGRQEGLPAEVLDIIAEHHGNDVVAYFYQKAKSQAGEDADLVSKNDYRYDAPIPDSKEAALVMICDSVEAASHTLKKPTPAQFEKLTHSIIMQKIEHGQMANSHLSLTDLDVISKTLVRSLVGRNHHRIEYPKEQPSGEDARKDHAEGADGK